jgi:Restriction endonuclease
VALGGSDQGRITEDEVKEAVCAHLTARGFDVAVTRGRVRGIDINVRRPDGRRCLIEAKAEVGKNGPQQVNYFAGGLGELVQRMDDVRPRTGSRCRTTGSTEAPLTDFPRWPRNG